MKNLCAVEIENKHNITQTLFNGVRLAVWENIPSHPSDLSFRDVIKKIFNTLNIKDERLDKLSTKDTWEIFTTTDGFIETVINRIFYYLTGADDLLFTTTRFID